MDFYLCRAKVLLPIQISLLSDSDNPREILRRSFFEKPSGPYRRDSQWHIGNINEVDSTSFVCRFGKTKKEERGIYLGGDFLSIEDENSPSTTIVVDWKLELIFIQPRWDIARKIEEITSNLRKALLNSSVAQNNGVDIQIGIVNDRREFMHQLYIAQKIYNFWMDVSRPNIDDISNDFVESFEEFVKNKHASKGRMVLNGGDMNAETLEPLAAIAAATGEEAGATILSPGERRAKKIRISGNPVKSTIDDDEIRQDNNRIVSEMREAYYRVREVSGD